MTYPGFSSLFLEKKVFPSLPAEIPRQLPSKHGYPGIKTSMNFLVKYRVATVKRKELHEARPQAVEQRWFRCF